MGYWVKQIQQFRLLIYMIFRSMSSAIFFQFSLTCSTIVPVFTFKIYLQIYHCVRNIFIWEFELFSHRYLSLLEKSISLYCQNVAIIWIEAMFWWLLVPWLEKECYWNRYLYFRRSKEFDDWDWLSDPLYSQVFLCSWHFALVVHVKSFRCTF